MPIEVDITQFSWYKQGYEKGQRDSEISTIISLLVDEVITFAQARKRLGISKEELSTLLEKGK